MEGSVSSSASQPPGPSPWKIAATFTTVEQQRLRRTINLHSALSKSVPSLENLCKATPVVKTAQTGALRDSQRRTHSDFATAIINLTRLTQSANEATAGIAAIPTSRI
ncbi:hypothetical protein [Nostoc sp. FACHB-110]|uniref:hypothetical protein n=1 Tax=Nostoc sp. FACHB-110 TaxID=2692834 RepID=UPI001683521D|nr:hypothetical protein [Nostoc sp. FACHB-110]MBD2440476.1 hypothetical protein [Nostoc sp. FACHB-110]